MADNIATTPGSGATIAADDVGGILHQRVKLGLGADGAAADLQGPDADGLAASRNLPAGGMLWNGASWDRQRGNLEGTLLASAARTTQTISATQTNYNARGVVLTLNASVNPGGGRTLQISVQAGDPVAGTYVDIVAFTASGASSQLVAVYPGAATIGSVLAGSYPLPRTWRAYVTPSDGTSWTYSLGYSLVV